MGTILKDAYTDAENQSKDILDDENLDITADELYTESNTFNFNWLKAKTGPGPIDNYLDHPLNNNGSKGVAQILRGLTGLAGELDLAIIDIGLGIIEVIKEKKNEPVNNTRE